MLMELFKFVKCVCALHQRLCYLPVINQNSVGSLREPACTAAHPGVVYISFEFFYGML